MVCMCCDVELFIITFVDSISMSIVFRKLTTSCSTDSNSGRRGWGNCWWNLWWKWFKSKAPLSFCVFIYTLFDTCKNLPVNFISIPTLTSSPFNADQNKNKKKLLVHSTLSTPFHWDNRYTYWQEFKTFNAFTATVKCEEIVWNIMKLLGLHFLTPHIVSGIIVSFLICLIAITGGNPEKNRLYCNESWGNLWCGCKYINWPAFWRSRHQNARGVSNFVICPWLLVNCWIFSLFFLNSWINYACTLLNFLVLYSK